MHGNCAGGAIVPGGEPHEPEFVKLLVKLPSNSRYNGMFVNPDCYMLSMNVSDAPFCSAHVNGTAHIFLTTRFSENEAHEGL